MQNKAIIRPLILANIIPSTSTLGENGLDFSANTSAITSSRRCLNSTPARYLNCIAESISCHAGCVHDRSPWNLIGSRSAHGPFGRDYNEFIASGCRLFTTRRARSRVGSCTDTSPARYRTAPWLSIIDIVPV